MKRQFFFQTCIIVLLLAGPAFALTWDINAVDSTGNVGTCTSIALDADVC